MSQIPRTLDISLNNEHDSKMETLSRTEAGEPQAIGCDMTRLQHDMSQPLTHKIANAIKVTTSMSLYGTVCLAACMCACTQSAHAHEYAIPTNDIRLH